MNYLNTLERNSFMSKVMLSLAITMIPTLGGLYLGLHQLSSLVSHGWFSIMSFFVLLGLVFAVSSLKDSPLGFGLLYFLTFIIGISLSSNIQYHLHSPEGVSLVIKALAITIILFLAMGIIGLNVKKDLTQLNTILMVILLGMIVAGLVNIFLGSTMLLFIISTVGAIVFSLFIIVDVNNIKNGTETSVVRATLSLYLDLINLFISLLNILGLSSKN